jgi:hypothetical protein
MKNCSIKLIHLKKEFFLEDLNLIKEQLGTHAQSEYSTAFDKFDSCLNLLINEFFNDKDKKNIILKKSKIIWYNSARLNQEVIIRACDDFYGSSSFNNVAILMDENDAKKYGTDNGFCYCKVCKTEYFIIIIIKF